jgi:DNA-binding transcriptional regulator YiaG
MSGSLNEEGIQIPSQLDKAALDPILSAVNDDSSSTIRDREVGLSDRELAIELGVNETTAYRWRTKGSKPRDKKLARSLEKWKVRGDRWYRIS